MNKRTTTTKANAALLKGREIKGIEEKIWKLKQGFAYRNLLQVDGYALRVSIERDSYDSQSHAVVDVFNRESLEWKRLYSIPYPLMGTLKTVNVYGNAPNAAAFFPDCNELLQRAGDILFGL